MQRTVAVAELQSFLRKFLMKVPQQTAKGKPKHEIRDDGGVDKRLDQFGRRCAAMDYRLRRTDKMRSGDQDNPQNPDGPRSGENEQ